MADDDVKNWNVADVCRWLEKSGLPKKLSALFEYHKINGKLLLTMTENDLRMPILKVSNDRDVREFGVAVEKLKSEWKKPKPRNINQLPDELMIKILFHLPFISRTSCKLVCQRWKKILVDVRLLNSSLLTLAIAPNSRPASPTTLSIDEMEDRVNIHVSQNVPWPWMEVEMLVSKFFPKLGQFVNFVIIDGLEFDDTFFTVVDRLDKYCNNNYNVILDVAFADSMPQEYYNFFVRHYGKNLVLKSKNE